MKHRNIVFWVVFSTLLIAGLGLKALTIRTATHNFQAESRFAKLEPVLRQEGYQLKAIQRPTKDKTFTIHIYQKQGCSGQLALLPLTRNSEGVELLGAAHSMKKSNIYFVFNGQRYQKFPAIRFWLHTFYSGITNGDNRKRNAAVWAVSETSPCVNALPIHPVL